MRETQWSALLVKVLKETKGAQIRSLTGNVYDEKSWPDKLIVLSKGIFLVEFKGARTGFQPGQKEKLLELGKRQPDRVFLVRQNYKLTGGTVMKCSPGFPSILRFDGPANFYDALIYASEVVRKNGG